MQLCIFSQKTTLVKLASDYRTGRHTISIYPSLLIRVLITQRQCCQISSMCDKSPLQLMVSLWGDILRPRRDPVSHQNGPLAQLAWLLMCLAWPGCSLWWFWLLAWHLPSTLCDSPPTSPFICVLLAWTREFLGPCPPSGLQFFTILSLLLKWSQIWSVGAPSSWALCTGPIGYCYCGCGCGCCYYLAFLLFWHKMLQVHLSSSPGTGHFSVKSWLWRPRSRC